MSNHHPRGAPLAGPALLASSIAVLVLLGVAPGRPAGAARKAGRDAEPVVSPAEVAMRSMIGDVKDRIVVRDGPARLDVWLFCPTPFDKMAELFRATISSGKTLVGGFRIPRWTWMAPNRTYLIDLAGPRSVRIRMVRHLKGTLLILPGVGARSEAPRWVPPYHPVPINLSHGPVM